MHHFRYIRSLLPVAPLWGVALLLWTSRAAAQGPVRHNAGLGIELNSLAGKVFRHEEKFTLPIPALTTGTDVNVLWRTWGRKPWHQWRHYPRLGIAAAMIHYGIDSVYGTTWGLYPNIIFPLLHRRHMEWTLRVGNGIGFVTRKYSRANPVNTVNVAISSTINDFIMIRTDGVYTINDHWTVNAGAFVTHISNGSVRKPNLGVNVAGISAGLCYYPVTVHPVRVQWPFKRPRDRYLIQARYSMSLVSAFTNGGPLYPVYIGTAYMSRRWRGNNKAFAGIDYSWHSSTRAYLRDNGLEQGREGAQSYKSAIIAGNEFLMGRVGILLQAGVYVKKDYLQRQDVYEKVTLNYYCVQRERGPVKELFAFVGLKAHLNVAEMGELGVGIGL